MSGDFNGPSLIGMNHCLLPVPLVPVSHSCLAVQALLLVPDLVKVTTGSPACLVQVLMAGGRSM